MGTVQPCLEEHSLELLGLHILSTNRLVFPATASKIARSSP